MQAESPRGKVDPGGVFQKDRQWSIVECRCQPRGLYRQRWPTRKVQLTNWGGTSLGLFPFSRLPSAEIGPAATNVVAHSAKSTASSSASPRMVSVCVWWSRRGNLFLLICPAAQGGRTRVPEPILEGTIWPIPSRATGDARQRPGVFYTPFVEARTGAMAVEVEPRRGANRRRSVLTASLRLVG